MRKLPTIGSRNGLFYYGDREGWYVVAGQNASGDALEESNFRVMARALGIDNVGNPYDGPNGQNADDTAAIESYGGAAGHGQWLLVRPGSPAEDAAREMLARMEDYPVLDDEDYSELEYQNAHYGVSEELRWRYRNSAWLTDAARDWIASAYLSEHDYGYEAGTDWDSRRQDRDTLAYAIRDWRQYRHRAVGKA